MIKFSWRRRFFSNTLAETAPNNIKRKQLRVFLFHSRSICFTIGREGSVRVELSMNNDFSRSHTTNVRRLLLLLLLSQKTQKTRLINLIKCFILCRGGFSVFVGVISALASAHRKRSCLSLSLISSRCLCFLVFRCFSSVLPRVPRKIHYWF